MDSPVKISKSVLFWFLARIFVGLIFAYAGLAKLLEPPANFEMTLLKYGVFPPFFIPWMARSLPWLEWILGSFMILGYAPRPMAAALAAFSLLFLVTLGSSNLLLAAGGSPCGCFGEGGLHLSVRQIFAVDLVNSALALRLAFLKEFPWSLHSFLLKGWGKGDDI